MGNPLDSASPSRLAPIEDNGSFDLVTFCGIIYPQVRLLGVLHAEEKRRKGTWIDAYRR
jgi:hypothetical protein